MFVVTGHGNSEIISDQRLMPSVVRYWSEAFGLPATSREIGPEDLAQRIRQSGNWQEGMSVVLLACNVGTGAGRAYAQRVANLLGVPVAGGDGFVASSGAGADVSSGLTSDGRMPPGPNRGLTWFRPGRR